MFSRLKEKIKKLTCLALAAATIITTALSNSMVSEAAEGGGVFLPFRNEYVNYITKNASDQNQIIQYVWMQLMKEETNWNSSQSYYTPGYATWAHKYYSDYVDHEGKIKSSAGVTVTYNKDFDGFLYQTVMANPDFTLNWISENSAVFKQYAATAKNHTYVTDAIIDLTADGKFLGGGKDAGDNVFLRGSNTSSNKYGATPKWSAGNTTSTTYDIDVLRFFGQKYNSLNDAQKTWVKTYMQWMVNDYANNGAGAVAAKTNSEALYNLIAASYEGFTSSKGQEFFDYMNNSSDMRIGDLIANAAAGYSKTGDLRTGVDDIRANISDMGAIFNADADCDYNSSWPGGTGSGMGDDDYDWLAYQIAMNSGSNDFYKRLNELVAGNEKTNTQMQEWIVRYSITIAKKGTDVPGGSDVAEQIADAVKKQGTTQPSGGRATGTWGGCGKSVWDDNHSGFNCGTHGGDGYEEILKPIGVQSFSLSASPSGSGHGGEQTSFTIEIVDSKGNVIAPKQSSNGSIYMFSKKYVWSSGVKVRITTHYRDGYNENVGRGACDSVHHGSTTINWGYAPLSECDINGHEFYYSYSFYDAAGNKLSDDSNAVPVKCVADGYCLHCEKTNPGKIDTNPVITDNGTTIRYEFKFAHQDVPAKSRTVKKGSATASSQTYSPSKNTNRLSQTSGMKNFGKTDSKRAQYTGDGNAVQFETYAAGTVSLESGAIKLGAKKIKVSATGQNVNFKLVSPKYGTLDEVGLYSSSQGENTWTFDCNEYSDAQLENAYVIVVMSSRGMNRGGHDLGDWVECTSTIQFNYITVTY